jgi:membrane associated rhomboid family serine protease
MLIPLRTDRPPKRRPIVTELLIILNLLVYLIGLVAQSAGWFNLQEFVDMGCYARGTPVWRLLTYQFLHDPTGFLHIAFNMLFLWVFGCAVEDRLGRLGFLGFYLIGGAVAGLAHAMASTSPVIGASGSIAGVSGAFLALFPRSRVKILFFFFLIGFFDIQALWFVLFYFVIDLLRQTMGLLGGSESGVAYMAHLAGYVYGFAVGLTLLATGILKREEFDIFYLFKQSRRRARFRAANSGQVSGPWDSSPSDVGKRRRAQPTRAISEADAALAQQRSQINRLIESHDLDGAARLYCQLIQQSPKAVLPEPRQLDVANQLYALNQHRYAADAYELFLEHYPHSQKASEVSLILGVIYTRKLQEPQRAREMIDRARSRLLDPAQSALAEQLLSELST